ncbi:MAG: hypothetical protein JWR67_380 [Mucilaginibacter sp.]|nr:hypothetical protein [Mucilaginibacter sp.]
MKIRYLFFIMLISVMALSCQKDDSVKEIPSSPLKIDSLSSLSMLSSPGNVLAAKGILKITVKDSTYTFDAEKDSIAFVNVYLENKKYFGITAINKAHTMSFGISSLGDAKTNLTSDVAGSQFLINSHNQSNIQYTLSKYSDSNKAGKINLSQFGQDSVLTKGSFFTFMATDAQHSLSFKVEGTFNLKIK